MVFSFAVIGILKVPPANQQLFNKDYLPMSDNKALQDYGLTSLTAKAQCPALVGLALRQSDGQFEPLEMTPFSLPPDLPDVMKSQENNGQEQSPWNNMDDNAPIDDEVLCFIQFSNRQGCSEW